MTGTKDQVHDIIWFTEACLSNVLRLETYIETPPLLAMMNSLTSSAEHSTRAARVPRRGRSC